GGQLAVGAVAKGGHAAGKVHGSCKRAVPEEGNDRSRHYGENRELLKRLSLAACSTKTAQSYAEPRSKKMATAPATPVRVAGRQHAKRHFTRTVDSAMGLARCNKSCVADEERVKRFELSTFCLGIDRGARTS